MPRIAGHIAGFCAALLASVAVADTVVPVATIRARAIITAEDLQLRQANVAGAIASIDRLVGMEARVVLYPGRPIRPGDVGPPALIERNQIVPLVFSRGGLSIRAEGRALDRAGVNDRLRVMNLSSRTTVTGVVLPNGTISVANSD